MSEPSAGGLGLRVPAFLLLLASAQPLLLAPAEAIAQPRPERSPALPLPDQLTLLKLLWSTMAAVDQANKTGNYSVLRDLGSAGFQTNNNAAGLAGIFSEIRSQRLDLSDTLIVAPTYEFPPAMIEPRLLRMRGAFNLRPTAIAFDIIYEWKDGWRLHGIAIDPRSFSPAARPR